MVSNEIFKQIDWTQYINAYEINLTYGGNGIKIQSKYKDINEITIEDLYHLDDPDYDYCMFEFEIDLKKVGDLYTCLLKGKPFKYYYTKKDKNIEITFEFDPDEYILTRHYKRLNVEYAVDNVENYYLNEKYVAAIIKFLWQRGQERQERDYNNSKKNNKNANIVQDQGSNNIDSVINIIKDRFKIEFNNRYEALKQSKKEITVNDCDEIGCNLHSEYKKHTIENILKENKIKYDIKIVGNISSILWDYKVQIITERTGDN